MIHSIISKNNVVIRLTDERWSHIAEEHNELAGLKYEVLETVTDPHLIFSGTHDELLACREFEPGKFLVVIYKEVFNDGFIITAFLTRRVQYLNRRRQLWP